MENHLAMHPVYLPFWKPSLMSFSWYLLQAHWPDYTIWKNIKVKIDRLFNSLYFLHGWLGVNAVLRHVHTHFHMLVETDTSLYTISPGKHKTSLRHGVTAFSFPAAHICKAVTKATKSQLYIQLLQRARSCLISKRLCHENAPCYKRIDLERFKKIMKPVVSIKTHNSLRAIFKETLVSTSWKISEWKKR